jgi:ribose transport system permease protein
MTDTSSHRLLPLLAKLGPFLALIALMIVFRLAIGESATGRTFWSPDNLRLMLSQITIVAVAACGMTMIIVSAGIDLSVGAVIAICSVAAGTALKSGVDPALAVPIAIAAGACCGAVTGGLIAFTGISPFIVTLGMMGVVRGAAKGIANEEPVRFSKTWINGLMHPIPGTSDYTVFKWMVVAPGVWIAAILTLLTAVLMKSTVFGRQCYAIGSNEAAARLCGVPVRRQKLLIYTLAGATFGLAGLLDLSRQATGNPTTGLGLELDIIAAVVIGGASLAGGTGSIMGTIIGALIMGVLRAGTTQLNWPTWVQEILIGAIIVLAVGIDRLRNRRSG